ncbi:GNAT family N-acetyltransferase [Maribacter sp. CXY002]|uniref:GNAT family N-acetyltransferase n=1 Tax=Maribacter luteocoastalis TaxID=3407671 RepID=UPI003B683C2F
MTLEGEHIYLRALEKGDLDFLYHLENNTDVWEISGTITPYSKNVLQLYLENAHRDIYDVKQLRLVVCNLAHEAIGLIDIFDFDPKNKRAGIGIVIINASDRNKGAGGEALEVLYKYAFNTLDVHQLYANILEGNQASIHLFQKHGFELVGTKKDWIFSNQKFKNELLFQKLNN